MKKIFSVALVIIMWLHRGKVMSSGALCVIAAGNDNNLNWYDMTDEKQKLTVIFAIMSQNSFFYAI